MGFRSVRLTVGIDDVKGLSNLNDSTLICVGICSHLLWSSQMYNAFSQCMSQLMCSSASGQCDRSCGSLTSASDNFA